MEAKRFIYDELNVFIKRFPKTRVRYEYDSNAIVHMVEVVPSEVYHLDEDYIQWEEDLFNRFVAQYPAENICFVSDDALVGITESEFVLEGLEYSPITTLQKTWNVFHTPIVRTINSQETIPFSTDKHSYKFNQFDNSIIYIGNDSMLKAA